MVRIVAIDRRKCRYVVGYFKTSSEAKKVKTKLVSDPYWKNNSIKIIDSFVEKVPSW